jgi:hypothetical protein
MARSYKLDHRAKVATAVLVVIASTCAAGQAHQSVPAHPTLPVDYFEARTVTQAERERFWRELLRVKDIQRRWENKILSIPGVTSIGIGRAKGSPVFIVSTEHSLAADTVPSEIDGVGVVVEVRGPVRLLDGWPSCNNGLGPPCHINQTAKPMEMGNSARWFQSRGGCTAGFKACDLRTGRTVFVTNSHCAQFSANCALAPLGDSVRHSADGPPDEAFSVGEISGHAAPTCGSATNFVDATKIDSPASLTSALHRDLGEVAGVIFNLVPPDVIHYSGRSSGSAYGSVTAVNVTVQVPAQGGFCCGALQMRDQVSFDPVNIVRSGDSGSGVLTISLNDPDMDRKLAGLLWGTDGIVGYFNTIERVLDALNLSADLRLCVSGAVSGSTSPGYDGTAQSGEDATQAE